jgi:hypothetical protein
MSSFVLVLDFFFRLGPLFLLSYWSFISSFVLVLYFFFRLGPLFLLSYWSIISSFVVVHSFFFLIGPLFLLSLFPPFSYWFLRRHDVTTTDRNKRPEKGGEASSYDLKLGPKTSG